MTLTELNRRAQRGEPRAEHLQGHIRRCFVEEFPRLARIPIVGSWAYRQYATGYLRREWL